MRHISVILGGSGDLHKLLGWLHGGLEGMHLGKTRDEMKPFYLVYFTSCTYSAQQLNIPELFCIFKNAKKMLASYISKVFISSQLLI